MISTWVSIRFRALLPSMQHRSSRQWFAVPAVLSVFIAVGYGSGNVHDNTAQQKAVPGTPNFSLAPKSYIGTQKISITDASPMAVIYYTMDGSIPTSLSHKYSGPIYISASATLRAIAVAGAISSMVATSAYKIEAPPSPSISPAGGTFNSAQVVLLSDADPNSYIYYTTDGSRPTESSQRYTVPIKVSNSTTLSALAVSGTVKSSPSSDTYVFVDPPSVSLRDPSVSLLPGIYAPGITVSLWGETNTIVCFTTDGKKPTVTPRGLCGTGSVTYSRPITLSSTSTITAIAALPNKNLQPNNNKISNVIAATYTIRAGTNLAKSDSLLGLGNAQSAVGSTAGVSNPLVRSKTNSSQVMWQLLPNPWGASDHYTGNTTVTYSGSGAITTSVAMNSMPMDGVNGYPLVFFGGDVWGSHIGDGSVTFPVQLSRLGSLVADVKYTLSNTVTPGDQDIAFDEWLIPSSSYKGGIPGSVEVIICPYFKFALPPVGNLMETIRENVLIDGAITPMDFKVYLAGKGPGAIVLFIPATSQLMSAELQLNFVNFFIKASELTGISDWYVAGFDFGTEYGNAQSADYTLTTSKLGIYQMLKSPTN